MKKGLRDSAEHTYATLCYLCKHVTAQCHVFHVDGFVLQGEGWMDGGAVGAGCLAGFLGTTEVIKRPSN